mmetsp:Transcript_35070/g.70894  ORF Transcript_35070/g.70894 Transcript_35070/m.70894 type:complete len:705 (-) Transcript_35070:2760-4874(-)
MGTSRPNTSRRKPKKPLIIRYESSGRIDGDGELKASPSMTSLSSAASSSSNKDKPVSERRGILLLAAACFFLWFLYTPKLLHRAGVIEKDPYEEFLESTVYPSLERGLARINANYTNTEHETDQASRPGYKLKKRGAVAKYPIVMVPGFVTSGLELWEGEDCAKKHFRQRFWGSVSMARTFFADRECWRRHLSLDPYTGGDPPSVRLRSAQGFEAADYFMATYWVWSKLIENFADVGYDGSLMTMMSYDWRLGYPILEQRDGYFTKLQYTIEANVRSRGEKVVLISHSMGGTVVMYFLAWVTADVKDGGGGGGKDWVEKHIHSFVNIAGTLLGVPKSVPALLSGELKDTAALLSQLGELLERYFGKRLRKNLWNTWGSLFGMLPKGGDHVWGVGADLCREDEIVNGLSCIKRTEVPPGKVEAPAPMVYWNESSNECPSHTTASPGAGTGGSKALPAVPESEEQSLDPPPSSVAWSPDETINYLLKYGGGYGPTLSSSRLYSFDNRMHRRPPKEQWHNPIATPLPKAPSMKIYCMYGTGIATERAYFYKNVCGKAESGDNISTCDSSPTDPQFALDSSAQDIDFNITHGVKFSDGDGSVPLLSLGYMCEHWKKGGRHNPSGIKVVTREHHSIEEFTLNDPGRGGPHSGEHVDILGHLHVMEDIIKIATDFEADSVDDQIVSDLKRIVRDIDNHPMGGVHGASKNR